MSLNTRAWLSLVFLVAAMGVLLFVPAGTVRYWQAWAYIGIYFAASALITVYLMKNDPALLRRRLRGGPAAEKETAQKIIMLVASLGFAACLILPALDHRFGWSHVPLAVVVAGQVMTVLWFYVMFLVFRENSFTSATIEIADDQRVVSTGPYALVRHPMYAGAFMLFFSMPLALGSYWGLVGFAVVLPALIWRLLDEERFLSRNLPGYPEYCARVRWRLIPGVF